MQYTGGWFQSALNLPTHAAQPFQPSMNGTCALQHSAIPPTPPPSPGLVPCPGLVGFHPHGRLSRVHAQHNPAHPLLNPSHTQHPGACAYQHSATPNHCCARQPTDRRAQHPRSVWVQPPTSSPLRPPPATNLLPTSPAAISSHTQHPALGSSDAANTSVRGSSSCPQGG